MYILINEKDIANAEVLARYHERMPDGRLIITPQELKTLGSIPECQIVATKAEVLAIKQRQEEEGVTPPEEDAGTEDAGIEDAPEVIDTPETEPEEEAPDTDTGTDAPAEEDAPVDDAPGEEVSNEQTEIKEEQDYGNDAGSGEL